MKYFLLKYYISVKHLLHRFSEPFTQLVPIFNMKLKIIASSSPLIYPGFTVSKNHEQTTVISIFYEKVALLEGQTSI